MIALRVMMNGKRDIVRDWRINPSLRMEDFGLHIQHCQKHATDDSPSAAHADQGLLQRHARVALARAPSAEVRMAGWFVSLNSPLA